MGSITQYTVTAAVITSIRLDGGSRTVIRADGGDLNIAYHQPDFGTGRFFTIKDGEAFIMDSNPVTGTTAPELGAVFFAQASGPTVIVQVWLQGQTQGA